MWEGVIESGQSDDQSWSMAILSSFAASDVPLTLLEEHDTCKCAILEVPEIH